jgi:hypothetical protein
VLGAIIADESRLRDLTFDYLNLKRRFFPGKLPARSAFLDWVLAEVKGNEIRSRARSHSHRQRSHAFSFLDEFLSLLEAFGIKIIGRLWVKGIGDRFQGRAVYTSSVQYICEYFNQFLAASNSTGCIIADSRTPSLNANVSHSVFTMKFRAGGDAFSRLLEIPVFGHSQNHVGIQIADLLCSALLFPLGTYAYCLGHVTSPHVHPEYLGLKRRFGQRIRSLQYMYHEAGRIRGGITVCDMIGGASAAAMF